MMAVFVREFDLHDRMVRMNNLLPDGELMNYGIFEYNDEGRMIKYSLYDLDGVLVHYSMYE
jgi:hypothetical protein